jgi:molybdopterin converting factor small subunit
MKVNVLFFGATADSVGKREFGIELPEGTLASKALDRIFAELPALGANHKRDELHFSVNQEYATADKLINEGDELAVFTAVSGG